MQLCGQGGEEQAGRRDWSETKGGRRGGRRRGAKARRSEADVGVETKRNEQARGQIDVCMIARVQARERAEKGGWGAESGSDADGSGQAAASGCCWMLLLLLLRAASGELALDARGGACGEAAARQLLRLRAAPVRCRCALLGSGGRQAPGHQPPGGHGEGAGKLHAAAPRR